MRALLFSSGVAVVLLLLAGCEEVMDKPSPAPMTDTAPSFSKTVADQAYLVEEIVSLTLPHATGGDGPLTYSLAPEIPGLMFDATTRTLSGAPTAADAYDMTYQAADADDNTAASDAATLTFTITVQKPEPLDTAPAFAATVADQTYTEGDAISPLTLPEASGGNGALSYSLMPAVPGLMFDAATRTLSGTPTTAGTYDVEYKVEDSDTNDSESDADNTTLQKPEPLDTAPAFAATVADAISPLTLPEASGGNGALSYSLMPAVPGLMFDAATRTLSGTPTTAGTYDVEYKVEDSDTNDSESDAATLSFTITVKAPPEPEPMACVPHPASQILGNWDASGNSAKDDEVYTFRANGTYQNTWSRTAPAPGLDQPPVTRTVTGNGTYSYVAETCLLTWSPEIANITHFVVWNGSDQFSTKFIPGGFVIITTFDRR